MRQRLEKLFYRWAYLDILGTCKKEDTYFYRFSQQIGRSNLLMMRSMSIFMLIISLFVIASTFTYLETESLRRVYVPIVIFEIALLCLIQMLSKKTFSSKTYTIFTALHLFHMLTIGSYIGVVYCYNETALIFVVVLTISSVIFTLPTMVSMGVATVSTIIMIIASYYIKERYWFESDTLNGISVLFFSVLFGFKINEIRAAEDIGEKIRSAVMALGIPHVYSALGTNVVTLSLGAYVGVPMKDEQPMDFVEQADKAMYQSKEEGRNRLTVMFR